MKKRYLSPKSIEIILFSEPLMNVLSSEQGGAGIGNGSAGDSDPELVGHRRGTWGNLWCE